MVCHFFCNKPLDSFEFIIEFSHKYFVLKLHQKDLLWILCLVRELEKQIVEWGDNWLGKSWAKIFLALNYLMHFVEYSFAFYTILNIKNNRSNIKHSSKINVFLSMFFSYFIWKITSNVIIKYKQIIFKLCDLIYLIIYDKKCD